MMGNTSPVQRKTPILLGTVQLGKNYGIANRIGAPSQSEALQILTAAAAAGIEIFDMAPNYGESEKILGRFLDYKPSPEPWLITKITSGSTNGLTSKKIIYDTLKQSILYSLGNLRCMRPPGLLMQNAADAVKNPRVIDSLLKIKQNGLVEEVGLSIYQEAELDFFLNQEGLRLIQAPYNIFDKRLRSYLPALKEKGATVWARSIFLQGLFFLDPKKLPEAVSMALPHLEALASLSKETGLSIEKLAFLFARDTPGLDGLVIGVETISQLEKNLELQNLRPLTNEQRARVEEKLTAIPERVYNPILWKTWR